MKIIIFDNMSSASLSREISFPYHGCWNDVKDRMVRVELDDWNDADICGMPIETCLNNDRSLHRSTYAKFFITEDPDSGWKDKRVRDKKLTMKTSITKRWAGTRDLWEILRDFPTSVDKDEFNSCMDATVCDIKYQQSPRNNEDEETSS